MTTVPESSLDVDAAVRARYSQGARERQESLCCPTPIDPAAFDHVPQEVIEKDYGCGDPSSFIRSGDTVLDLGSGAGRICYVASRIVGPSGRVIGVDMNDDMLAVANRYLGEVGERLGYRNVEFRKGRIQDLQLDCAALDRDLAEHPIRKVEDLARFEALARSQRSASPLIAGESIDLVVSNCVLNLVPDGQKPGLFQEIHRVLKKGGRVAISDIVCDENPPPEMKRDPELWSGCLSGAMREDEFVKAFEDAGFYGIRLEGRSERPWRVIDGLEFRSLTVTARKGKEGPCLERRQAVVFMGPWKQVEDDDGHILRRGERSAVCDKTFKILTGEPYDGQIVGVEPNIAVSLEDAQPFGCNGASRVRQPRETKEGWEPDDPQGESCDPNGSCC